VRATYGIDALQQGLWEMVASILNLVLARKVFLFVDAIRQGAWHGVHGMAVRLLLMYAVHPLSKPKLE
jgi:hypothetical protein